MNRMWAFVKPYRKWSLIAILFMLGEVTLDILQPILMVQIVDVGIAGMDMNYVFRTCMTMVAVALLGVVGGVGNCYFSTKAGYGFARDLRGALYRKIQSFSFANIDQFSTGSLVTRTTNDVTQIQNAFQSIIRMLVRSPFLFIGGVIAVFSIDHRLSLVVAAAIPVLGVLIWFLMSRAFPMFRIMQDKMDRVNVVMQENLAGVRVIKAFGRAPYEKERFGEVNDDLTNTGKRAMKMMAMSFPLINLVMNACTIAVFWFGGNMVLGGTLMTGQIMAFVNYIAQIIMSLTMSSFMLLFVSRAKVSVDRVNEILITRPDIADAEDSDLSVNEGRVEFRDVSFSYPGQAGEPVLNHISFVAEPGTTTAILGSTGSGKTSLVSLIPRLYDANGGAVLVDGRDVREYRLDNLRKGIGVVLQESILFSGTVSENLRWGDMEASDERIFEAAEIAQADEFIRSSAEGYETMMGQRGVNFSGGQKQRMSIARALVKRPKILIMDDSTSAVDLSTEAVIQRRLREALGEMTVFIIAQRVSSVMDADRIIVMDDGKISDMGTHRELKERSPIYREIVISQLGEEAVS